MGYDFKKLYGTYHAVLSAVKEGARNIVVHYPRGNSKLGKIPAWNLLPGVTCSPESCAHCMQEGCYAVKNCLCHGYDIEKNNCLRAWTENTVLIATDLERFENSMIAWFSRKRKLPEKFRIHSSGDFLSVEYARAWFRIAERFPTVRFLAFSKQWDIIRAVPFYTLPNFELVLSGWTGIPVPEDLREHYRVAWCDDGTETRIPDDAYLCPGDCNSCGVCWFLSILNTDTKFIKH